MLRYRLGNETVAVHTEGTHPVAIIIPCGTILNVLDRLADTGGFVDVEWDGKTCKIFNVDLRARAEIIGSAGEEHLN